MSDNEAIPVNDQGSQRDEHTMMELNSDNQSPSAI